MSDTIRLWEQGRTILKSLARLERKIDRMAGETKQQLKDAEQQLQQAVNDEGEEVKRFIVVGDTERQQLKDQLAAAQTELDEAKADAVGAEDVASVQGLIDSVKHIFDAPNTEPLPPAPTDGGGTPTP